MFRLDIPDVRRHKLAHCNGWPGDHPMEVKQAAPVPAAVLNRPIAVVKLWPDDKFGVPLERPLPTVAIKVLRVRPAPEYWSAATLPPAPPPGAPAKLLPWPIRDADIDRVPLGRLPSE